MSARRRPRAWAGALLAASWLATGCSRPAPRGGGLDLATLAPGARPWTETSVLDLGRPESGRYLRGGFASARRARPAPFRIGVGGGSALDFWRADSRPFTLRLRGETIPSLGPASVKVTVKVNGERAGEFLVGPATVTATVEVASALLRSGENRLALEYEATAPVPPRSAKRQVMVAWYGFRFGEEARGAAPAARAGGSGGVAIAAGQGIDYFLELGGDGRFALEDVVTSGGATLAADVACEGDRGGQRTVLADLDGPAEATLRPAGAPLSPCRLTLRVAGPPREGARVEVRAARVWPGGRLVPVADAPAPAAATAPPASVVIYLVDTLRADRLGVYGYPRPVSPAIDRFAREAVVFEHARAQSSWTRPAVATVLTGLDPVRHGASRFLSRLADGAATLGERLHAAGYWTGLATANPNVAGEFGFDQGFDAFDCVACRGAQGDDGEITAAVHRAALAGLDRAPRDRPFFLFVHTVEPHAPYRPTEPFRARFAAGADPELGERRVLATLATGHLERTPERERAVADLYDAEVALADAGFGAFLEELARRGRLDTTAVLFLSDHGEELFEHGNVEHGRTLYEEQLRVPMIWRLPRGAHGGRRVVSPVDQLDIVPTVLALAGLPADPELPGRSLAAALAGGEPPAERPSLAWLDRHSFQLESVAYRSAKLVRDLTPATVTVPFTEALFDLAADPGELRDLAGERGVLRAFLGAQMAAFRNRWGAPLPTGDAVADEALEKQLRALGYLQ